MSQFKKIISLAVYIIMVFFLFQIFTSISMHNQISIENNYTRLQTIQKMFILNSPLYILGFMIEPKVLSQVIKHTKSVNIQWGYLVLFALFFLHSNPYLAIYFYNIVGLNLNIQMISDNYNICCILSSYYLLRAFCSSNYFSENKF